MKTFYSVQYGVWGSDRPRTAWFDKKELAERLAATDYADRPVRHTYKSTTRIEEAEERVLMTKEELA